LVKLVGFNIHVDSMSTDDKKTPETIVGAYARISKSPDTIKDLHKSAQENIEKTRELNEKLIFEYGHNSIAEHAVFNFDISGVSRLAIEKIEHHRLCSFTEKSQRYTNIETDVSIPIELRGNPLESRFVNLLDLQNDEYKLYKTKNIKLEDARYITSLSVHGQMGMTINARNLNTMIGKLKIHTLQEVKQIGSDLEFEVLQIAPSLIKAENNLAGTPKIDYIPTSHFDLLIKNESDVLSCTPYGISESELLSHCKTDCEKISSFHDLWKSLEVHDVLPRSFELIHFQYFLSMSATCFAQIKRHRMATIIAYPYKPTLGVVIPRSINDPTDLLCFIQIQQESTDLYTEIVNQGLVAVAEYALTQANMRRVYMQMNLRELYHFSRLRQDNHAQWEIRDLANKMIKLAKKHYPQATAMLCGRDKFEETKLLETK